MSKVYNRVEWAFLKKLLEKLGFDNRWISLISSCIHFVSFFFMVNGAPHGHFTPNRDSAKGIPYSLICFYYVQKVYILLFS